MDARQRVALKAEINRIRGHVDSTGFEKYEKGEGKWVITDLENGLKVEIEVKITAYCTTVFIHLYS